MCNEAEQLAGAITALLSEKERLIIAIDGRCAAGKSTFAAYLQERMDCAVFHMDEYFLRPEQRTDERLNTPGGNVDYERFRSEILLPLESGAEYITYRPFDCKTQMLGPAVKVCVRPVNIVEGSYSCHPELWDIYDLHIFLRVSAERQMERIVQRNGKTGAAAFRERWIPLEERYFSAYRIEKRCDYCLEINGFDD